MVIDLSEPVEIKAAGASPCPVAAPAPGDAHPREPAPLVPGQRIAVLYWHPNKMPDGTDLGSWDTASGRVITATPEIVVFLIDNPSLPTAYGGDGDCPFGSPVRFARPDTVYPDPDAATLAAATMTPPGRR